MATAAEIRAAAERCRPWHPASSKRWICDVAQALGLNTDQARETLLTANRVVPGGLLRRCDLVQAADQAKLAASEIRDGNAEFHFVELP